MQHSKKSKESSSKELSSSKSKEFFHRNTRIIAISLMILGVLCITLWVQIPHMIAQSLAKKLKVPVEIKSLGISWRGISFYELSIGNPKGYTLPYAFKAKKIELKAPLYEYFQSVININEVRIDDVYLGFEFLSIQGPQGNWSIIMSNLEASQQSPLPKQFQREAAVSIAHITLSNIHSEVYYRDQEGQVIVLDEIPMMHFTDVNSKKGIPSQQLMDSVLVGMLTEVFTRQNLRNMMQGVINIPARGFKMLFAPLTIFGSSEDEEPLIDTPFDDLKKEKELCPEIVPEEESAP